MNNITFLFARLVLPYTSEAQDAQLILDGPLERLRTLAQLHSNTALQASIDAFLALNADYVAAAKRQDSPPSFTIDAKQRYLNLANNESDTHSRCVSKFTFCGSYFQLWKASREIKHMEQLKQQTYETLKEKLIQAEQKVIAEMGKCDGLIPQWKNEGLLIENLEAKVRCCGLFKK